MRSGRRESPWGTLRFRLTFWNSLAILLVLSATLIGLREGLRLMLLRELDQQLAEDAVEVGLMLEQHAAQAMQLQVEIDRKARSHEQHGWYVRIFDASGLPRWASAGAPDLGLPPPDASPTLPLTRGNNRVTEHHVGPAGALWRLRVGATLTLLEQDVGRLDRMMLAAGLVLALAIPLTGYWLAGRATQPLAGILDTTARLQPTHLAERLPLRGTGDELDRLSATINGLLDRLAHHLERHEAFVADAAHELRSPLAALRASVEVALQRERSASEYQETLAELAGQCEQLGTLVNQLLLLATTDAGRLPTGTVPARLDELAVRACDMFRGVAEQRGVSLIVAAHAPTPARGDPSYLRTVLNNLLDNAIKFTPAGGSIVVEVTAERDGAILRVRDTGLGIHPADLPHVFDRFYRIDKARDRSDPTLGSGLGLSICQAIVGAYGGRMTMHSEHGRGTMATVVLPIA